MNYKRRMAVFFTFGMTALYLTGCGFGDVGKEPPKKAVDAVTATPEPTATLTPAVTPKPTATPKPTQAPKQEYDEREEDYDDSSYEEEDYSEEENREIRYADGNITSTDGDMIYVEMGSDGDYYTMAFDVSEAELDIQTNEIIEHAFLRTSLNVELEYYERDGVNVVTYLYSDGMEYFSQSALDKMKDNYYEYPEDNYEEDYETDDYYEDYDESVEYSEEYEEY